MLVANTILTKQELQAEINKRDRKEALKLKRKIAKLCINLMKGEFHILHRWNRFFGVTFSATSFAETQFIKHPACIVCCSFLTRFPEWEKLISVFQYAKVSWGLTQVSTHFCWKLKAFEAQGISFASSLELETFNWAWNCFVNPITSLELSQSLMKPSKLPRISDLAFIQRQR